MSNYSFYAIPAMWVTSIVPHIWAVNTYDAERAPGTPSWNNADPQSTRSNLKVGKLAPAIEGRIARAEQAQNNGFMNLPLFAAAITAGNLAGLPVSTLNTFAGVYIASRVAFNLAFVFISDSKTSLVRSAFYLGGIFINMSLFIKAGNLLSKKYV